MYAKIKTKKRVYELWADRLIAEGVVSKEEVDRQAQEVWDNLTLLHQRLKAKIAAAAEHEGEHITGEYQLDRSPSPEVDTAVPAARLRELGEQLLRVPEGFTVHPKLVKQLDRRREALAESATSEPKIDWAHGEALAFASLLTEGTPLRLTGQDTERGTFSQRHMVLHDAKTGQTVCPIQSLPDALAPLELHNSPLSELACMGFEYGYSLEAPETLVLWEAQFGDFVNSAQVIVDQFITSGLAKWGQTSRLTLLLPHGYEGAGPEHSSARLERFLQLCAENNMQVCVPSTPAQMFHMLRRQMHQSFRKPLIVMTPKSLLRHELSVSALEDLTRGAFARVIAEIDELPAAEVRRAVFCSGKVYFDLLKARRKEGLREVALVRIEQLYPFPTEEYQAILNRYPNLREVVWCQEEPQNQGAWYQIRHRLQEFVRRPVLYAGRAPAAAPATGIPKIHEREQQALVSAALHSSTTEESARETTRLTPPVPGSSTPAAPPPVVTGTGASAVPPATPMRKRS
jgi:2-oxoglutarate dehydrogenase E1 component